MEDTKVLDAEVLEKDEGKEEEQIGKFQFTDDVSKKIVQTEIARKKHYREKVRKLEEELKKIKETPVAQPVVKNDSIPPVSEKTDTIKTVLELRSQGFSESEILKLMQYSEKMKTPITEVAKEEPFKVWMETERAKAKVAQATPSPSNRTTDMSVDGKKFSDLKNDAERRDFFEKMKGR